MLNKKRVWLGMVSLLVAFCFVMPASAAANPTITNLRHSSVTQTTARIDFNTSNPGRLSITNCGVQVRKPGCGWTTKKDTVAAKYRKYTTLNSWYEVGAGKEVNFKMAAGTKYEYRGFCVTGGKTYYSAVKSFVTVSNVKTPSVVSLRASNVTQNSARVDFNTSNPSKVAVTHAGLQIRKKGNAAWTTKIDTVAAKYQRYNPLNSYYQIGSGREVNFALSAGTTYEYRGFCRYNGTNFYSGVQTFTTPKAAGGGVAAVHAPVNLGAGRWYALTYPGHGTAGQYYATDWNLPGNADKGQAVYALANGVVESVYPESGSILIRYTESMQLTNGYTFKGNHWHSWYGHMNTISVGAGAVVKKGQAIGTIGKKSASTEHLHVSVCGDNSANILSGYNNAVTKSMAISPYWIKGLNNANLYCDDANGTRLPAGLYESTILNTGAMPR